MDMKAEYHQPDQSHGTVLACTHTPGELCYNADALTPTLTHWCCTLTPTHSDSLVLCTLCFSTKNSCHRGRWAHKLAFLAGWKPFVLPWCPFDITLLAFQGFLWLPLPSDTTFPRNLTHMFCHRLETPFLERVLGCFWLGILSVHLSADCLWFQVLNSSQSCKYIIWKNKGDS